MKTNRPSDTAEPEVFHGEEGESLRLRVAVVSHAYNDLEVFKTLEEFAKFANVSLVAPREHRALVFDRVRIATDRDSAVSIHALDSIPLGRSQFILKGLTKAMRAIRPDVVVIEYDPWSIQFHQSILALSRAHRSPAVVGLSKKNTYRRLPFGVRQAKYAMARAGIKRTTHFIAASERVRRLYVDILGLDAACITVQPHLGIDTSHYLPHEARVDHPDLQIVYVGNVSAEKGISTLIRACTDCRAQGIALKLRVIGPMRDARFLEEMGGLDWLTYEGAVSSEKVASFLEDGDVFVMPTHVMGDHEEHDGRAVLEALASGLPCIVSNSGVLAEIVDDTCGVVTKAGDVDSLSRALTVVATDVELRTRLGRAARSRGNTFSNVVHARARYDLLVRIANGV